MSGVKVLLVEDEVNFGSVLSQFLKLNDFEVTWTQNGKEAWSLIKTGKEFDVCVLDVMMPEMDGISLGKEIRSSRPELPFVFLTAKSMKEDMIEGFEAGADDYITKPFDSELLVYKLKALLQRRQATPLDTDEFQIGTFLFDSKLRLLRNQQIELRLSPKECAILKHLAIQQGQVVSRESILHDVWQEDNYFNRRSMDVYMSKLRKYLGDDPNVSITSLHAGGYVLNVVD